MAKAEDRSLDSLIRGSEDLIRDLESNAQLPAAESALPEAVLARLMCLRCRNTALRRTGDEIICPCGARYAQDRGVFDFDPGSASFPTASSPGRDAKVD